MPETEISNSVSALFVAFVGILALNAMIMFFASLLGRVIGSIFDE